MRSFVALIVGALALSSVAQAQTATGGAAAEPGTGYIEGVAHSAFGNVTSQSYGAELGVTIVPGLQVFAEGGQIQNVATADISASAQKIAGFLSQSQNGTVSWSVKQPVTFFAAGARYLIPTAVSVQPYVMGGFGMAKVKQQVAFLIGGSDVTSNLQQYGVQLGTDLSGDFTKPILIIGGGVAWPVWQRVVLDFQYRYGRIMADDGAITAQRAGLGVGVRF